MSCPYATLLGERGKGFHKQRFLGLAFNDTIGTIGLASISSYATKTPFWKHLVGWFVVGEIMHYGMCVDTAFLEMVNLSSFIIISPELIWSVSISPSAVPTPKRATSIADFGGLYTIAPITTTPRTIRPLRFLIGQVIYIM